jgi:hypothetical protein
VRTAHSEPDRKREAAGVFVFGNGKCRLIKTGGGLCSIIVGSWKIGSISVVGFGGERKYIYIDKVFV